MKTASAISREVSRDDLKKYREVISMWLSKYDTSEIGHHLDLPEWLVARWVANFRDMSRLRQGFAEPGGGAAA